MDIQHFSTKTSCYLFLFWWWTVIENVIRLRLVEINIQWTLVTATSFVPKDVATVAFAVSLRKPWVAVTSHCTLLSFVKVQIISHATLKSWLPQQDCRSDESHEVIKLCPPCRYKEGAYATLPGTPHLSLLPGSKDNGGVISHRCRQM